MKIIFDTEDQKEKMINILQTCNFCPGELGLKEKEAGQCTYAIDGNKKCGDCWENMSGIEMEVKA